MTKKTFTLLELVIVLLIIGALATLLKTGLSNKSLLKSKT